MAALSEKMNKLAPVGTALLCGAMLLSGCAATVAVPTVASSTPSLHPTTSAPAASATKKAAPGLVAPTPTQVKTPRVSNGMVPVIKRIETKEKIVFITIDDGGIEEEDTVAVLHRRHIPITAFLSTALIDQPAFYQRISRRDGQTIQNHSNQHTLLPGRSDQQEQICTAQEKLKQWYGEKPWIFRPPFGSFNDETRRAAYACGLRYLVNWTINMPEGGKGRFQYQQGSKLRPGDVILAHWRPGLGQDLRNALKEIERQGFQVAALQDYLPRK